MARQLAGPDARSHAVLSAATSSRPTSFPTWEAVHAVLSACGASADQVAIWKLRHDADDQAITDVRYPEQKLASSNLPSGRSHIWHVPVSRRADFEGRAEDLERIDKWFRDGGRVLTLHGLPGIGKTQLAVHYAHLARSRYDLVWLIRGSSRSLIRSGLASLARDLLGARRTGIKEPELVDVARNFLSSSHGWLLIVDSLFDQSLIGPLLPDGDGSLLVTTAHAPPHNLGLVHEVRPIRLQAATRLIAMQSGARGAISLARDVKGIPLVIQQAKAYMRVAGIDATEYRRLLRLEPGEMLSSSLLPDDYDLPASRVWRLSLTLAKRRNADAITVLNALAVGAESPFPIALLTDALFGTQSPAAGRSRVLAALKTLEDLALVTPEKAGLVVHPLFGVAAKRWYMRSGEGHQNLALTLRANLPFEAAREAHRSVWASALPHVLELLSGYDQEVLTDAEVRTWLHNRVGTFIESRGRLSEALAHFEAAVKLASRYLEPGDPYYLSIRSDMLICAFKESQEAATVLAEYRTLISAYEQGLRRARRVEDGELSRRIQIDLSDAHNNLGYILVSSGDPAGAITHLDQAITTYLQVWRSKAEQGKRAGLIDAYLNLSWARIELRDYKGGAGAARNALEIVRAGAFMGENEEAIALENLGVALEIMDPVVALRCHRDSLKLRLKLYGPNDYRTLVSRLNRTGAQREVAYQSRDIKLIRNSRASFETLITQVSALKDPRRDELLETVHLNLGFNWYLEGKLIEHKERSDIGFSAPQVTARKRQAFQRAEREYRIVLAMRAATSSHISRIQVMRGLAMTVLELGRGSEALRLLSHAIDAAPRTESYILAELLYKRALAHEAVGDPIASRADARSALELSDVSWERAIRVDIKDLRRLAAV